jgi:hypothetical protein
MDSESRPIAGVDDPRTFGRRPGALSHDHRKTKQSGRFQKAGSLKGLPHGANIGAGFIPPILASKGELRPSRLRAKPEADLRAAAT